MAFFFVLSFATVILYWAWFFYLKYVIKESEANKEVMPTRIFGPKLSKCAVLWPGSGTVASFFFLLLGHIFFSQNMLTFGLEILNAMIFMKIGETAL